MHPGCALIASSFITYRININPFKRIYKLSLKQIINFGEHVIDELNSYGLDIKPGTPGIDKLRTLIHKENMYSDNQNS